MKTTCDLCGIIDHKQVIQADTHTHRGNVTVTVTLCSHCHHAVVAVDTFDFPTIDRRNEQLELPIDPFDPKV